MCAVNAERHRRAKEVFLEAVKLEAGERRGFLERACGDDFALREEVQSLLREDEASAAFLSSRAPGFAALAGIPGAGCAGGPRLSQLPERLANYTMVRKLGEGGMGAVYEALQDSPRRRVALKVTASRLTSEALVKRFEHESQILGLLEHPGIARIYEAGTAETAEGRVPYFAMELIEGRPLTDHLRQRRLGLREKLDLIARICDAVEHAHQRGVIHRDLKPGNMLVDREGNPKILDFGIARATDPDHQLGTRHTQTGQILGTLSYMSPEQASGESMKIDHRSDVYSLGVILYEILAGRLPHDLESKTLYESLRILKEEEPARLSAFNRACRGDVETIVSKAIEKDPERRYRSAADFASDLRRHLRDEPILAHAPSTVYVLRKFARRHKFLVGALVVLLVTAGVTTWLALAATRAERVAEGRYEDARSV
ncbi:MAG: serine/threonine-protein kinase, partial [Thermoanaerobaculia bacterium]